jgi:hypothetical protein
MKKPTPDAERPLGIWQETEVFSKTWMELNRQTSSEKFFGSGEASKSLREGFISILVAEHLGAHHMRLCKNDPPDFEIRI